MLQCAFWFGTQKTPAYRWSGAVYRAFLRALACVKEWACHIKSGFSKWYRVVAFLDVVLLYVVADNGNFLVRHGQQITATCAALSTFSIIRLVVNAMLHVPADLF